VLPAPETLGLDYAFTALFMALLAPQIHSRGALIALIVAALVSVPLTPIAGEPSNVDGMLIARSIDTEGAC
jgi:predicted branched-subunit amino acid permease